MPHIRVSERTHARIEKHGNGGFINPKYFTVHADGTVTFWVSDDVKSRLDAISSNPEQAIIRALDTYEGRKSEH